MDSFVNPPQVLKEEARKRESEREKGTAKPSVDSRAARARRAAVPARARAA